MQRKYQRFDLHKIYPWLYHLAQHSQRRIGIMSRLLFPVRYSARDQYSFRIMIRDSVWRQNFYSVWMFNSSRKMFGTTIQRRKQKNTVSIKDDAKTFDTSFVHELLLKKEETTKLTRQSDSTVSQDSIVLNFTHIRILN